MIFTRAFGGRFDKNVDRVAGQAEVSGVIVNGEPVDGLAVGGSGLDREVRHIGAHDGRGIPDHKTSCHVVAGADQVRVKRNVKGGTAEFDVGAAGNVKDFNLFVRTGGAVRSLGGYGQTSVFNKACS